MRANEFLIETTSFDTLPAEPGATAIPDGTVRLYHQTSEDSLKSILQTGLNIEHAKGIEGPRAIYASQTGFYGSPGSRPTLEFYVDKSKWVDPFVLQDVPPSQIIAGHLPWHSKARYIIDHPDVLERVLAGKYDNLTGDYADAIDYIKTEWNATHKTKQPIAKSSAVDESSFNENFADGKNPGRKGLAKRVGVNTKASVSSLRKTAKNSSGEKQRMAHWLANMKAGRAKNK